MGNHGLFTALKGVGKRKLFLSLCVLLLWGISVLPLAAQSTSGNIITFDADNSTMLYCNLNTSQTALQRYSCYLRHHQAPIQILNANPTAPTSGTNAKTISPLDPQTGFFAKTSLVNNMNYNSDGHVQFSSYAASSGGYKYLCFAIVAPKGYRFTEYRMDIDGSQGTYGATGATIMRYTYNEGSTYEFTPCAGETMALTNASSGQLFSHTLSNAENILFFRVEAQSTTKQVCVTMKDFRFKYVIEKPIEASLPNTDGMKIHTGYVDFGTLSQRTNSSPRQYFFDKENVTDLQEVKVVAEDASAAVSVYDGSIHVNQAGTYWVESPAKYRITSAKVTFEPVPGSTQTNYESRGKDLTSILGKPVKMGDGNGNYLVVNSNGSGATNTTTAANATTWYITAASAANTYYIQNASGAYLLRNNSGTLTTGTTATTWTYYENYSISWTYWLNNNSITSEHCFITTSGGNNYGLRCNNGNWAASRQGQNNNTGANYKPCPINYYEVVTISESGDYTATLYGTDPATSVGTADVSTAEAELSVEGLDNDGVKFEVSGAATFKVDLAMMPLDPTLQTLEFGYMQDGEVADHFVPTNATNFKFNAGETVVVPIAPKEDGTDNGDSHQIVFHKAMNENRTTWYDGTGSGKKFSQYFLVDSEHEKSGSDVNAPADRTDAYRAGTVKVDFSNIKTLTNSGGTLTETEFNKENAHYDNITLQDGGAEQQVYIYSADKPTHRIMTDAGMAKNTHIAYTFYEAKLKAVDVVEQPVIEVTPLYTSTLKGENVKAPLYNAATNSNVSVAKDTALDTEHVFYGVKVTSDGALGYLTTNDIVDAIKAELSKTDYKVYAGDVLRTVLYVDMSSLTTVSGGAKTWEGIMFGTADNCLFFMPKSFSISQSMVGGGIIAGGESGTAVTDIVVNDQQPFFSPYEFYTSTHVARYFRTKVNDKDLPKNTTIVLPFTLLLSPDGHLRTASDQVNENVQFFNLTTELSTPEDGVEGEVFNVGTQPLTASASIGSPMALAFKPYHLVSEEQTETTAFMIEATGTTIPRTPAVGDAAFTNDETGMVGYGSLNGVAVPKTEEIFYFSKNYFWNSKTLRQGDNIMILPYRAYYKTSDPGIKGLSKFGVNLDPSETATGIDIIAADNGVKGVYDLTGRRMSDDLQSLPKGVYIVNGKKCFVK